eukprot:6863809-Pyramimonas_sp.AAC.1
MARPIIGKAALRRSKLGSKSSGTFTLKVPGSVCNTILALGYIVFIGFLLIVMRPRQQSSTPLAVESPKRDEAQHWSEKHHWSESRRLGKTHRVTPLPEGKEEPYEHVGHEMDQRLETCLKGSHEAKADEAYVTFLTGNQVCGPLWGVLASSTISTTTSNPSS